MLGKGIGFLIGNTILPGLGGGVGYFVGEFIGSMAGYMIGSQIYHTVIDFFGSTNACPKDIRILIDQMATDLEQARVQLDKILSDIRIAEEDKISNATKLHQYGQKHEKVCGAVRASGRLLERRGQGKPF